MLVLWTLAGGCGSVRTGGSLAEQFAGDDLDRQMEFWHTLAERPVACNDEAFHALLLYLDGTDPAPDYATRVETLRSRRMLPAGFGGAADEAVERGTVAVVLVNGMKVKGGWAMAVFGSGNSRYATRELQYLGVYPPSSSQQLFSGQELVGIIGRAEDYQRGNPTADAPAAQLPSDVEAARVSSRSPAVAVPAQTGGR